MNLQSQRNTRIRKFVGLASLLFFAVVCTFPSRAGKVDLSPPKLFSGANLMTGVFEYYLKVTDLDFGGGAQPFPIRLLYTPAEKNGYNYLGKGWTIPFFDSSFNEYREGTARVHLLCGKIMYFQRDKSAPTKWTAKGGWQGLSLNDHTVEIFRKDGWRLRYEHGFVTKVTNDQDRHWMWVREKGRIIEVRELGGDSCHLSYTEPGFLETITFGSAHFGFTYEGGRIRFINQVKQHFFCKFNSGLGA